MHRIESRNAFVACVNNHATGDLVVFLICEHCGAVGEAPSAAVAESLNAAAKSAGFSPKAPVLEISGAAIVAQSNIWLWISSCPSPESPARRKSGSFHLPLRCRSANCTL